ncbi:hypothetical protein [Lactobacillus helveticus]|uniref:hypothetical protein n=1 Tax=Lactobacillus helveticus TaxID=1587 RepID=UPI00386AB009
MNKKLRIQKIGAFTIIVTDNLGSPAIMLREANTNADRLGVNLDVFKGYAYLFLDNGTPAEPGKPFSVQTLSSLNRKWLDIVKPYIKK